MSIYDLLLKSNILLVNQNQQPVSLPKFFWNFHCVLLPNLPNYIPLNFQNQQWRSIGSMNSIYNLKNINKYAIAFLTSNRLLFKFPRYGLKVEIQVGHRWQLLVLQIRFSKDSGWQVPSQQLFPAEGIEYVHCQLQPLLLLEDHVF